MKHLLDVTEVRAVLIILLTLAVTALTFTGIAPPDTLLRVFEAAVMFFIGAKAVEQKK
jgi:hypothetical protein